MIRKKPTRFRIYVYLPFTAYGSMINIRPPRVLWFAKKEIGTNNGYSRFLKMLRHLEFLATKQMNLRMMKALSIVLLVFLMAGCYSQTKIVGKKIPHDYVKQFVFEKTKVDTSCRYCMGCDYVVKKGDTLFWLQCFYKDCGFAQVGDSFLVKRSDRLIP